MHFIQAEVTLKASHAATGCSQPKAISVFQHINDNSPVSPSLLHIPEFSLWERLEVENLLQTPAWFSPVLKHQKQIQDSKLVISFFHLLLFSPSSFFSSFSQLFVFNTVFGSQNLSVAQSNMNSLPCEGADQTAVQWLAS